GCFDHDRFRGYLSVHCCSGLLPPCLRFVMLVTDHHARLGTRLRAKLCRGRPFRRPNSMSFEGAIPTKVPTDWVPLPGDTLAVHLLSAKNSFIVHVITLLWHVSQLCEYWNGLSTSVWESPDSGPPRRGPGKSLLEGDTRGK